MFDFDLLFGCLLRFAILRLGLVSVLFSLFVLLVVWLVFDA